LFNSGAAIGAILAPPLIAWILLRSNWPAAFLVIGCSGLLWLAVWWWFYRTPASVAVEASGPPLSPNKLFREPFMWSLTAAKAFFDPAWYFYIFWFPQYLSSIRNFDLQNVGLYAWIPFLTAGIGNLAGGAFSAALLRHGVSVMWTRRCAFIFFCALMTTAIPAVLVSEARWAIGLVSTATFGYTGALANMLALPADAYPKDVLGSIWGLASMGAGLGGMLFTLLTGIVVARFSYTPVFFTFGLCPLVSAGILVCITTKHLESRKGLEG
jgi:ACS family hexuronate transporter-like MFS transporter